jgi:hypothetical protein
MGFLSGLGKVLGVAGAGIAAPFTGGGSLAALGPLLGAAGAGLGAVSQSKANNRGEQYGGQLDLEQLLMARDSQNQNMNIAREQEGRAGQTDAFRKLLSAQHVLTPAAHTSLSPYSAAPRTPTDAETSGADALTQQVLARLQGGNPIAPVQSRPITANDAAFRVDPKLLDPSKGESIMGWLGALLGGTVGAPKPQVMSGIPSGAPRA